MPPLKQPKDLVSSCYSVLSQVAAKAIYDHRQDRNGLEALRKHFGEMPHGVLEGLYFWVIQVDLKGNNILFVLSARKGNVTNISLQRGLHF